MPDLRSCYRWIIRIEERVKSKKNRLYRMIQPVPLCLTFKGYCSCSSVAFNLASISGISAFTQVPTLRRYQGESFAEPKA